MDAVTIQAISSLWPLALIISLTLLAVIFRSQISNLFAKLVRVEIKKGETEVVIVQQHDEGSAELPLISATENTQLIATTVSTAKQPTESGPASFERLTSAVESDDLAEAEMIFRQIQDSESDQTKRYNNDAQYLYLLYSRGDLSALDKLVNLTRTTAAFPESNSIAWFYIAQCYDDVANYSKAIESYEAAKKAAQKEQQKAICTALVSRCLLKSESKDTAIANLSRELGRLSDPEALSLLYKGLAELYEDLKDYQLRALALEKSLEYRPNDIDLRFDAAYSYGEVGLEQLAAFHYQTLLRFSPNNRSALNNMAVALERLDLPLHAVNYFKKAWKQGNTLAAANLASSYINAGFADEAREVLEEAKTKPKVHANVGLAMSKLADRTKAEKDGKEQNLEEARQQLRNMSAFAEAYFRTTDSISETSGSWLRNDGATVDITSNGNELIGIWGTEDERRKFNGILVNRGALIRFYKWGYDLTKMEKGFVKDGEGFTWLSVDGSQLHIMKLNKDKSEYVVLRKAAQPPPE